jgi:hypothetical protein
MSTTMTALNASSIKYAEFVRLTTPDATYTFCSAAAPITVSGITFVGLGSLLGIGEIQQDIKASSYDLKLMLTGIDPANIALILGNNIKGSTVEIWRGFLDANNQIITTPTQQFFKRYQGIVSNFAINEDFNEQLRTRIATAVASCSSMRFVLENRVTGVRTNESSWQFFYPNDTSMNRVPVIASTYFDFGKQPIRGGNNEPVEGLGFDGNATTFTGESGNDSPSNGGGA